MTTKITIFVSVELSKTHLIIHINSKIAIWIELFKIHIKPTSFVGWCGLGWVQPTPFLRVEIRIIKSWKSIIKSFNLLYLSMLSSSFEITMMRNFVLFVEACFSTFSIVEIDFVFDFDVDIDKINFFVELIWQNWVTFFIESISWNWVDFFIKSSSWNLTISRI